MARPPLDSVLRVIRGATPLLQDLEAARITLDGYVDTVQTYTELVKVQQAVIASLVADLQSFADEFVGLYTNPPAEEV